MNGWSERETERYFGCWCNDFCNKICQEETYAVQQIAAYSITSSASNWIELGTSMPSALAVCRLMTNSDLVAYSTVRSAFEHDFSVRSLGKFVFALPHASSNCVWNKFVAPRRMAPLRSVPRSLTPVRFATVRSAPLRLASFKLAPLRSAPSGWRRPGWRTSGRRRSGWRGSGRRLQDGGGQDGVAQVSVSQVGLAKILSKEPLT